MTREMKVPPGWQRARVADIAEVRLGRQRSPSNRAGTYARPYLRAANVTWKGLDLSDVMQMDFKPSEFDSYVLRRGDVLLSEASGSPGEVGKPALWTEEIEGCCFQNTLIRVRTRGPLPSFLRYRFLHDALSGRFASASKGVGIHHLGAQRLAEHEIAIPSLPDQKLIVAKIEKQLARLDAGVEALQRLQAHLRRHRAAIMRAACGGGGGRAPAGWTETTLGELSEFVTSGSRGWASYYSDNGPIFIRAQDINTDRLALSAVAHVQLPKGKAEGLRTRVRRDDLLVTVTGANVTKAARIDVDVDEGYVSQHVGLVRMKDPAWAAYLHYWITSPGNGRGHLMKAAYGAGKPGLNLDNLRELPVLLPPESLRDAVVARLDSGLSQSESVERTIETAMSRSSRLRASILRAAFEGRLVHSDQTARAPAA